MVSIWLECSAHTQTNTQLWWEEAAGMKAASLRVLMFLSFSLRVCERLCFNTFAASIELFPYWHVPRAPRIRCCCCKVADNTSEQIVLEVKRRRGVCSAPGPRDSAVFPAKALESAMAGAPQVRWSLPHRFHSRLMSRPVWAYNCSYIRCERGI